MNKKDWMDEEVTDALAACAREVKVLKKSLAYYEKQVAVLTKAKDCKHKLKDLEDPLMVRVQCTKCKHIWCY